ncbi:MAG: hypothetical protein ACYTKD_18200 [Planctomycetota bacterium]|jgi:hypothetical protein
MTDAEDPAGPAAPGASSRDVGPARCAGLGASSRDVGPARCAGLGASPPDSAAADDAAARVESWEDLLGQRVVVDTDTTKLVVGTLEDVGAHFVALAEADVHDMRDSRVTSEVYTLEALKYGVRANRKRVFVRTDRVVCVSRLEDVIDY